VIHDPNGVAPEADRVPVKVREAFTRIQKSLAVLYDDPTAGIPDDRILRRTAEEAH
jgi:hypothetical protein